MLSEIITLTKSLKTQMSYYKKNPGYYNDTRLEVLKEVFDKLDKIIKAQQKPKKSKTDQLKELVAEQLEDNRGEIGYASFD